MPDDGYVNPDKKPYSGRYTWVPPTIPTASDTAGLGWLGLVHERGTFRNDFFISSTVSTNYTLIPSHTSGVGVSYYGSPEWPINKSFRRKQNPTPLVPPVPDKPFWVKSNTFWWQADFPTIATKLSAITFEYSLLVDIYDPRLLTILNEVSLYGSSDDYKNLLDFQTGVSTSVNIDWTKYIFGKIKLFQSSDTEDTAETFPGSFFNTPTTTTDRVTYTSTENWDEEDIIEVFRALPEQDSVPVSPSEYTADYSNNTIKFKSQQPDGTVVNINIHTTPILATGYFNGNSDSNTATRTITVHFDYGASDFRDISKLKIQPFYTDGPLIKFSIKKILLFRVATNSRPNISNTQLPCQILAYAFNINCAKTIPGNNDYYPNNNNNPTFYVKMFHPEDVIKSRGFAHAIDLRFFVPSFPIYSFNGITLTGSINADNYWVVFVGPLPSKKSVIYYFTGEPITSNSISGRLVRINDIEIQNNKTIYIQKINSDTQPEENSNWSTIYSFLNTSNLDFPSDFFVAPWLFYDSAGTSKSWYRLIVVDLNTSVSSLTSATKGLIYSEKSALKLETTGVSNVDSSFLRRSISLLQDNDPLNLMPIAYFTVDNIEDLLGSNILFRKGQWKLNLRAKSNDTYNQTNTHVFLRMWFHPGEENIDYNNPHQYRSSKSEIIFEKYDTDPTNLADPKPSIKLNIGNPTSLDNLIVSPPLTENLNTYEILRYADGLLKDGSSNNIFTSPYVSLTTKLVIGVYSYSFLQNLQSEYDLIYNPPTVEIELDPIVSSLETCILQNSTGSLAASRYYLFDRTNYVHFNTDASNSLKLTRNLYEGGFVGIGNSYIPYSKKIQIIDSTENPTGDSRIGLISFESGLGSFSNPDTLVCIEHENYSLYNDKSIYYYADFTTKDSTFQDGKVNASTWSISFQLRTSTDTTRIPSEYKIMAFFADRYGVVTERIFTSPYLKLASNNGTIGVLNYSVELAQPFFITGTDAQLIVRLIAYPVSANNQTLTDSELTNIKNALSGNPIGTRIKNFYLTITSATPGVSGLTKLKITDASGFTGSTRFYEDLDLVPSNSLDSQSFWFYASAETLKAQIIENGKDFFITGALYSPTWFVKLPRGIEVNIAGGSVFNSTTPYGLRIRTVLDDIYAKQLEDIIKVGEELLSNYVHVFTNGLPENNTDQTNVIQHLQLEGPMVSKALSGLVAGSSDGKRVVLSGEDPVIIIFNSKNNGNLNDILGLFTETQTDGGSKSILSINAFGGQYDSWTGPNYYLYDNSFGSNFRSVSDKITKIDIKFSSNDDLIYIVGLVNPGALMMKVVNPYDAGENGYTAPGINYVIDGPTDIKDTIDYNNETVNYSENLSGNLVNFTRPSLSMDKNDYITAAYVLEGQVNKIVAKRFYSSFEGEVSFVIADMGIFSVSSNDTAVFCPVLAYDEILDLTYCAFWSSGKIFITTLPNSTIEGAYVLSNITLVAGNRDFTTADNTSHPYLKSLVDNNYLVVEQLGDLEVDIPRQSVGIIISKNKSYSSDVFIYYKNENSASSNIYVRKLNSDGSISERYKVS